MSNPNKRKGTAWESEVRDYLNAELGKLDESGRVLDPFDSENARRPAQEGAADIGDVHAVPFILECKNVAKVDLPGFIRQANTEAGNAGFPFGAVVIKKRRGSVRDGYVAMDLATFSRLLAKVREAYRS